MGWLPLVLALPHLFACGTHGGLAQPCQASLGLACMCYAQCGGMDRVVWSVRSQFAASLLPSSPRLPVPSPLCVQARWAARKHLLAWEPSGNATAEPGTTYVPKGGKGALLRLTLPCRRLSSCRCRCSFPAALSCIPAAQLGLGKRCVTGPFPDRRHSLLQASGSLAALPESS